MKRLLISAAALTLLGAPAAFAQDNQVHDRSQWQGRGSGGQQQQSQQQQSQQQQGGGQWSGGSNQGQGRSQQTGGQPDWNAYYRNNPDLQRAYRQNQQSSTYHESVDAFAQRHYQEHGRAEGRALPTTQGDAQSHPGMRYDQSSGWIPAQPQGRQYQQNRAGDAQSHPGMRYDQSSGWIPAQPQGRQYQQNQAGGDRWQGRSGDNRNDSRRWQGGDRQHWGDRSASRDWRSYQRNIYAQHRYRLGSYRWPGGYNYRRFAFGEYLPQIFFAQDYWIYDYADYGLPYPPPGTQWVRYGPDALLIDQDTGEIVQVIYSVFY